MSVSPPSQPNVPSTSQYIAPAVTDARGPNGTTVTEDERLFAEAAAAFDAAHPVAEVADAEIEAAQRFAAAEAELTAEAAFADLNAAYTEAHDSNDNGATVELISASSVAAERVDWAYEGRIPLKMITLIVGQGGTGKSLETHHLAAGFSRGTIPGALFGTPVDVAIASVEDVRATTIVPRLTAAGADLSRVHFIQQRLGAEVSDIELGGEFAALEVALAAGGIRVLIIDTVVAHIPSAHDSYKEQHVRRVLAPLSHMAERLGIAVIGVMHLNRREAHDVLTRIHGSGGFGNLARSVLLFARDPDDPEGSDTRYLTHAKCNVATLAPTIMLHIEPRLLYLGGPPIETAVLVDDGEVSDQTAAHLLGAANDDDRGAVGDAEDFLRQELANGPVACAAVRKTAERIGISLQTLRLALHRMGIKGRRVGMIGEYTWSLLESAVPSSTFEPALVSDKRALVNDERARAGSTLTSAGSTPRVLVHVKDTLIQPPVAS
jgi:AAA domain